MGPGPVTWPSTSPSSSRTSPGPTSATARPASAGPYGQYNVIYEFREENVGVEAGRMAVALVNHLVDPVAAPFDLVEELERLILLAERSAFGPSTQALIDEAVSRDIPFIRLDRHSLVQLGQGVHQQRIRATMTSRTSAIGVDVASDKSLTNRLLDSAGLPVPRSEVVDTEEATVAAARRLGFPCVVKPLDGNHGRGVHLDLRSDEAVRAAFHGALAPESEWRRRRRDLRRRQGLPLPRDRRQGRGDRRARPGLGHRRWRARDPPARRARQPGPAPGIGHEKVLTRIRVDAAAEELVRAQGWELDAVPPPETWVKLALTGNMSTGGTSIDRTIEAHPDNVEIAETAARIVGLDVAGIDFICPDIATPVRETGGAIVEVNAAPGFRMHTHPTEGEPQYVAKPVIDNLFPPGSAARIPIIAVTGTNGKTTTVRMIAHILKLMGRRVGMTSTDGIVVDGRLIKKGDMSGPKSAQMVLQNPTVDTAVFEVARGGILREGLGYDRNDVAVVTNVTGDHLGLGGIDSIGQLANVKGVVVEAVPRSGTAVLNADDPHVARMGRHCAGRVVYFTLATEKGKDGFDRVDGHLGRGGAAFAIEPTAEGDLDRPPARGADDAGPLHPPHPGDVRRPGPDERRQRARRRGRGVGRRAPTSTTSGRAADVLDLVLPGARAAQPARDRRGQGRHRLLPQRRRDAPAGRLRRADGERAETRSGRAAKPAPGAPRAPPRPTGPGRAKAGRSA